MLSEVNAFSGVMPSQSLGELSHNDHLRLFCLNELPSRPCSVRFTLADNSLDSKTILDRIVSIGIPGESVRCIQRFSSGLVGVTLTKKHHQREEQKKYAKEAKHEQKSHKEQQ